MSRSLARMPFSTVVELQDEFAHVSLSGERLAALARPSGFHSLQETRRLTELKNNIHIYMGVTLNWSIGVATAGRKMILTIANIKGGVGKTTLSVNIAIARALDGFDVLLVDADEQGSAADFTQIRTDRVGRAGYTAMRLKGREIRSEIDKLRGKFDDIIIDVGGQENEGLRAALMIADQVLVPVQPSTFDVWSFEGVARLVSEATISNPNLQAFAVLNAADAQGRDNDEARELLNEVAEIKTLAIMVVRRKAFRNAAAQGRSVLDMIPRDAKAVQELSALVSAIYSSSGS
jgi:chromosome partitioning protein